MTEQLDAAAMVVCEVMLALGKRGHMVAITEKNGVELMRHSAAMLELFGIKQKADDGL